MAENLAKRYQFQPWPTRLYRRVRFMPLAYATALWELALWFLNSSKPFVTGSYNFGRLEMARLIWGVNVSRGHFAMQYYFTGEEVFGELLSDEVDHA